jgi:hypothetical protein
MMPSVATILLGCLGATLCSCAVGELRTAGTAGNDHFQDRQRALLVARISAMLDELGEDAPRPQDEMVRFVWSTAFEGDHVFTVGIDGDTGFVRSRHRPAESKDWEPPELRFLDSRIVLGLVFDRPSRAGWKDPGICADGEDWLFEGYGWSCFRHSPEADDDWRWFGQRIAALADFAVR